MKQLLMKIALITIILQFIFGVGSAKSLQQYINYDENQAPALTYNRDVEGNRVPDFSYAGYKMGKKSIPDPDCTAWLRPLSGDNSFQINKALNNGSGNVNSYNVVCLSSGVFRISSPILLNNSFTVLRGVGDDQSSMFGITEIVPTWTNAPAISSLENAIIVGGGSWNNWYNLANRSSGTFSELSRDVLVNELNIVVENNDIDPATGNPKFKKDDWVLVTYPCTPNLLSALNYGGTPLTPGNWTSCSAAGMDSENYSIQYFRKIESIVFLPNTGEYEFKLNAPIFDNLNLLLSVPKIYKVEKGAGSPFAFAVRNDIGIENLVINIPFSKSVVSSGLSSTDWPYVDESRVKTGVQLWGVEDFWMRNATIKHFYFSAFSSGLADRITIENVRSLEPVGDYSASRRYAFSVGGWSQNFLFKDLRANYARHSYIPNGGYSTSNIVFLRTSGYDATQISAEAHKKWHQAILFDNYRAINSESGAPGMRLGAAKPGTSHGWLSAHSVTWNSNLGTSLNSVPENKQHWLRLQKPPTAQNYSFGFIGDYISNVESGWPAGDLPPIGYQDGQMGIVEPKSLYEQQCEDRGSDCLVSDITFLSDLIPVVVDDNNGYKVHKDENIYGNANIVVNGMSYDKGVATHSNSSFSYLLNGEYSRFMSDVGIDDKAGSNGSVIFRVYSDGVLSFLSEVVYGNSKTVPIDIDVRGVYQLTIEVNDAGDGGTYDHGSWANARLLPRGSVGLEAITYFDSFGSGEVTITNNGYYLSTPHYNYTYNGSKLKLDGVTYEKGIWIHANASVEYVLNHNYKWFMVDVGLDDFVTSSHGSVIFKVYGDNVLMYQSPIMGATTATETIKLDVRHVSNLRLEVNDSGNGKNSDHANWANARLLPISNHHTPSIREEKFITDLTVYFDASNSTAPHNNTNAYNSGSIRLNGIEYFDGVGVLSRAIHYYGIDEKYERFRAEIGVDDATSSPGSLVFKVFADSELLYASPAMNSYSQTISIDVPIHGEQSLTLVVEDAGSGGVQKYGAWANARVINYDWDNTTGSPLPPSVVNNRQDDSNNGLPKIFRLHQNFPNPFNSITTILYDLPETSKVRITVYDVLGRQVELLFDNVVSAGYQSISYDASALPSGIYIYRIEAGSFVKNRSLIVIK